MEPKNRVLPALTSLRFFAAFHIVLYHYATGVLPPNDQLPSWGTNLLFAFNGFGSVSFFYLLSGFVLFYRHAQDDFSRTDSWFRFYRSRFARIYPLYIVSLMPVVAYLLLIRQTSFARSLTDIFLSWDTLHVFTLTQSWVPWKTSLAHSWNYPAWSLSIEAFFYLLFPLLIRPITSVRPRKALALAAILWTGTCLYYALHYYFRNRIDAYFPEEFWIRSWFSFEPAGIPLLRLPEFVLGMLAARYYCEWDKREAPTGNAVTLGLFAATVVLLAAFASTPVFADVMTSSAVLAPFFVALILVAARPATGILKFFTLRPIVALGEASYALYILQMPVHHWFVKFFNAAGASNPNTMPHLVALYLIAIVVCSFIAHARIEKPMQALISGKLRLPRPDPARWRDTVQALIRAELAVVVLLFLSVALLSALTFTRWFADENGYHVPLAVKFLKTGTPFFATGVPWPALWETLAAGLMRLTGDVHASNLTGAIAFSFILAFSVKYARLFAAGPASAVLIAAAVACVPALLGQCLAFYVDIHFAAACLVAVHYLGRFFRDHYRSDAWKAAFAFGTAATTFPWLSGPWPRALIPSSWFDYNHLPIMGTDSFGAIFTLGIAVLPLALALQIRRRAFDPTWVTTAAIAAFLFFLPGARGGCLLAAAVLTVANVASLLGATFSHRFIRTGTFLLLFAYVHAYAYRNLAAGSKGLDYLIGARRLNAWITAPYPFPNASKKLKQGGLRIGALGTNPGKLAFLYDDKMTNEVVEISFDAAESEIEFARRIRALGLDGIAILNPEASGAAALAKYFAPYLLK